MARKVARLADLQDDELAPAAAPGAERDRGGEADRDRRAGRREAEQGPKDDERRQTEMDDEEGLHGVLHRRIEGNWPGLCLRL